MKKSLIETDLQDLEFVVGLVISSEHGERTDAENFRILDPKEYAQLQAEFDSIRQQVDAMREETEAMRQKLADAERDRKNYLDCYAAEGRASMDRHTRLLAAENVIFGLKKRLAYAETVLSRCPEEARDFYIWAAAESEKL